MHFIQILIFCINAINCNNYIKSLDNNLYIDICNYYINLSKTFYIYKYFDECKNAEWYMKAELKESQKLVD